jgi:hypothetical protein
MTNLSAQHVKTINDAAKKLTDVKRWAFQAQAAIDYLNSKPHLARMTLTWDRRTVTLGLNELRTGFACIDNFKAPDNKKTELKYRNWKSISLPWLNLKARLTPSFRHCSNTRAFQPMPCARHK